MKRILILAILLMSSLAWAGSTTVVVGQGGGGEPPPSCDVLLCGDFEGTGAEAGWSGSGNGYDFDYSTTGLSMEGDECLRLDSSSDTATGSFTSKSEVWGKFMWRTSADTAEIDIFKLRSSTTVVATLYAGTTYLEGENGSDWGATSLDKAANTTYYVWFYYVASSTWDVYVSTNTTQPDSPTLRLNGAGISASAVDNIWFSRSTGTGYNYYDDVWISDSSTGWATW